MRMRRFVDMQWQHVSGQFNHTGITAYIKIRGALERTANHSPTPNDQLQDPKSCEFTISESQS
jgi:hypothetical protein